MKEARKIADKVILLLMDILVLGYQIVRKVLLPTRNRKGNILSSLLSFFVGLVERLLAFEKNILRQPVVFKHKYVKQGLVIAVGFLFLLSSVEWTVGPSAAASVNETQAVVINEPSDGTVTVLAQRSMVLAQRAVNESVQMSRREVFPSGLLPYKSSCFLSAEAISFDRNLRYCLFRI